MIDLYSAATPNGQKIHIMLEETGLAYHTHWVRISRGEQFKSDYLSISPNNKIPAIVDHDGPGGRTITLFESGAILLYLADKTGRFLPEEPHHRWETVQWLMWQMGGFGPMLGQAHHFNAYAPMRPDGPVVLPYAQARYTNEAARLYGVLDKRLSEHDHVAAGQYTIADMAIFPWCRLAKRQRQDIERLSRTSSDGSTPSRRVPRLRRDMDKLEDIVDGFTPESWEVSFGARQKTQT